MHAKVAHARRSSLAPTGLLIVASLGLTALWGTAVITLAAVEARQNDIGELQGIANVGAALLAADVRTASGNSPEPNSEFDDWVEAEVRAGRILGVMIVDGDGYPVRWAPDAPPMSVVADRTIVPDAEVTELELELDGRTLAILAQSAPLSVGTDGSARGALAVMAAPRPWDPLSLLEGARGRILAVTAAISLLTVVGTVALFRHRLDHHLFQLIRPVGLSESRWYQSLPAERNDTIGHVARTLVDLYEELEYRRTELAQLKRTVDHRVAERVRQIQSLLRRAEQQAWMDPLTRLGNRRLLDERLEQVFESQLAAGDDLSIVMLDIDHFKSLNDTLGHVAGDRLLSFVGDLLRSSLRASDIGIRYGGDEFVLLLLGVGTMEASATAERLTKLFAQKAKVLGIRPSPSISGGVASRVGDGATSGRELLEKADRALYTSKRRGRNLVTCTE